MSDQGVVLSLKAVLSERGAQPCARHVHVGYNRRPLICASTDQDGALHDCGKTASACALPGLPLSPRGSCVGLTGVAASTLLAFVDPSGGWTEVDI